MELFPLSPRCICTGSTVRELPRNDHFLNITRCTPLLRYDCPVKGCVNTALFVSCARAHAARHVSEGNKLVRYSCLECSSSFASPVYLDRHILALHSNSRKARCEPCSGIFAEPQIAVIVIRRICLTISVLGSSGLVDWIVIGVPAACLLLATTLSLGRGRANADPVIAQYDAALRPQF